MQQDPFVGRTPMECHQREGPSCEPLHMHSLAARMKQPPLLPDHDMHVVPSFPVLTGEMNLKSCTLWARTLTKGHNIYRETQKLDLGRLYLIFYFQTACSLICHLYTFISRNFFSYCQNKQWDLLTVLHLRWKVLKYQKPLLL